MDRKLPHIEAQICARLRTLKKYISIKVDSAAEAEDIYGETVLKIWRIIRSGKFKEGYSIDAFMMWCARSCVGNYYQNKNRYSFFVRNEYVHHHNTFARNHEREYEIAVENRMFIEKVMRVVSAVYRKVLILLLFQNMRHWEIAETLGISRVTVSGYLFRMRNSFEIYLNRARRLI